MYYTTTTISMTTLPVFINSYLRKGKWTDDISWTIFIQFSSDVELENKKQMLFSISLQDQLKVHISQACLKKIVLQAVIKCRSLSKIWQYQTFF